MGLIKKKGGSIGSQKIVRNIKNTANEKSFIKMKKMVVDPADVVDMEETFNAYLAKDKITRED